MKAFEAKTIVLPAGEIRLTDVPLSAGTEVEVFVTAKRATPEEFQVNWQRVCAELRALPQVQQLDDAAIESEVAAPRAAR